jgi:phage baseplate assembly protein W
MKQINKVYSDLDFNFSPHPITGDIIRVYDENAIKQSVKNIVLTNFFEVPFDPSFGSNVTHFLFEPASPIVEDAIKSAIYDIITAREPRVDIISIDVSFNEEDNAFTVVLVFSIIGLDKPITINVILNRAR